MITRGEISSHWNAENAYFRVTPPTVLGIKEASFEVRRDIQKAFRQGFEAGVKHARSRSWLDTAISDLDDLLAQMEVDDNARNDI